MIPHPVSLGKEHALRFQDQSVVDRYHLRPTYPTETFQRLASLIVDEPRAVLDIGCGTGEVARHLIDFVERIDAVDISLPMLEKGRKLPGGDSPKIRWLHGRAEDIPLSPPYALITAGQSIHWMEWDIVLPRFQQMLTSHGVLAILNVELLPTPWEEDLTKITRRYSTNPHYRPIDLLAEFKARHLFEKWGEHYTVPVPLERSVRAYIEAMHAQSSLSRDHMTREMATAFDEEVQEIVAPFAQDGKITLQVIGHIFWGRPLSGKKGSASR
jgi:ubiquinone/menaquinone biosynthesis C-methylase UbiE